MTIVLQGEPLTQADLANLEASFITPELAEVAGLRRVDSPTGAALVGQNGSSDYSGIVFPYFLPDEDRPREYRIRRDTPDYERKTDGSLKEIKKYVAPPGRGNMLYFPPGTHSEQLQDASLPIAIVEGEKKCLAVH